MRSYRLLPPATADRQSSLVIGKYCRCASISRVPRQTVRDFHVEAPWDGRQTFADCCIRLRLIIIPNVYNFPILPGVCFSPYPLIILAAPGVVFGKLYLEYNLPEQPGSSTYTNGW